MAVRSSGYFYTRIGKLTSTDGLAKAVGKGAATVTFEKPKVNERKVDFAVVEVR